MVVCDVERARAHKHTQDTHISLRLRHLYRERIYTDNGSQSVTILTAVQAPVSPIAWVGS
jgi:hypothetical protein